MVTRSVTILDELDSWINVFRAKMLEHQRQSVDYTSTLNMVGRLGTVILSNPEELTEKQKSLILKFVEEANNYKPPYARIKWADKYLQHMVPKIIDATIKEPHELENQKNNL